MLCIPFVGPFLAVPLFIGATIALVGMPTPINFYVAGVFFLIGLFWSFLTCVTGYIGVFLKNYKLKLIDREKGGEQANVNISMPSLAYSSTFSRWKYNISRIRGLHRLHPPLHSTPCSTSCSAILNYLSSRILSFFTFSFRALFYYFFTK